MFKQLLKDSGIPKKKPQHGSTFKSSWSNRCSLWAYDLTKLTGLGSCKKLTHSVIASPIS